MISEADLDELLSNTDDFFSNVHYFDCAAASLPGKSYRGATITHVDLMERREDFTRELRNTLCSWVYSKSKYRTIFDEEFKARKFDAQNAAAHIQELAREKFRAGFPQGQFGELLLFNLIQHFFAAPPLLRKMPITTNPAVERHGADAVHYRLKGGTHVVYLGEAKTYKSKYKFAVAMNEAITSIFNTHALFQSELALYVYDDFIDEPLRQVAKAMKRGELQSVQFELVCVVSYAEVAKKEAQDELSIKARIEEILSDRLANFDVAVFGNLNKNVAARIHYIVMPFWDFDDILTKFES